MRMTGLSFKVKAPMLACGADLKGAFALAKGNKAYLFDGFGDLSELDNFKRYEKAVHAAIKKLKINPVVVVCDLHPGYFSTAFAKNRDTSHFSGRTGDRKMGCVPVQHHEAHIASAIVDNGLNGEVFGAAFDGTGYGWDGNIWGGEFFKGGIKNLRRAAHLDYIPMPGGEACIREPWRMAASYLYAAFGEVKGYDKKKWAVLKHMIDKKLNSPLTSSMGRLFDAVASMVLDKRAAKYEAQLPIELEKNAAKGIDAHYDAGSSLKIVRGVARDIKKMVSVPIISAKFHNSIAQMVLNAARLSKLKDVVLSGGVFQNRYLTEKTVKLLSAENFNVYTHSDIETNDSGIPIGQIAIANARWAPCV